MNMLQYRALKPISTAVYHEQNLLSATAHDRCHQAATHGQLLAPGLRQFIAAGSRNNPCIRPALGKTQHAVTQNQVDIRQPQRAQVDAGLFMQRTQALNGVHLFGYQAEHRGLVTAAGADLQHRPCATPPPGAFASSSHMRATMLGLEMVCPRPMGKLVSW